MAESYLGSFVPLARCIRVRSQAAPLASTLAHCAAVRRIERCSRRSSGGAGGRPRLVFAVSMFRILAEFWNHKKELAFAYLLNHNKCTDKRTGASKWQPSNTSAI